MQGQPVITKSAADDLALGANGSYSNEGNALQHVLYDTYKIPDFSPGNGTTISYFTQPIGATYGNGSKTFLETNLQDSGKLPNGQTFLIKEMAVSLKFNQDDQVTESAAGHHAYDLLNAFYTIQENSLWEIKIAGREWDFQAPGTEFIPNLHCVGADSSSVNPARFVGDVIMSGWVKMKATPIPVGQLVSFSVKQIVGSQITAVQTVLNEAIDLLYAQNAEIQVKLRGMLTRSI